jgi:methionyl-tRNA synthetase
MPEGLVSFEEFKKMDLRVARVVSVADHPNASKLYVIQLDIGGETRQTVAGLKGYYTPAQLVGKHAVAICNLAPAVLRGERSEAMLLAAQQGEKVVLVVPEAEMAPGSRIL